MSKYKAGLHKEVSVIFNGVSLPKDDGAPSPSEGRGAQQPSTAPALGHQDYIAPKSPAPKASAPEPPAPKASAPEPPAPKSPAPEPPAPKSPAPEPPAQKPSAPEPSAPKPPAPEPPAQKPSAPSHMTPTKPKPKQPPVQSPPEAAPAKQPKADTAIKAVMQIPWQRTLEQIKNKLFALKLGVSTTRQKKMVILAPVLFIVLIFMFIQVFSTPSQKITGPGTFGPAKAVASSDSKADWQVPELYPTTLRDPMRFGSVTTPTETGGLIVKGIVYSEDNPCAVIGDQIVHEGDKVLDVVIIKINEKSVEFEANGKKWTQKVQR